jgi:hypothetical protein
MSAPASSETNNMASTQPDNDEDMIEVANAPVPVPPRKRGRPFGSKDSRPRAPRKRAAEKMQEGVPNTSTVQAPEEDLQPEQPTNQERRPLKLMSMGRLDENWPDDDPDPEFPAFSVNDVVIQGPPATP